MKSFLKRCRRLSGLWILGFLSILSIFILKASGKDGGSSTWKTAGYGIIIAVLFIGDLIMSGDILKKSGILQNQFERARLSGLIRILSVIIIANLLLIVAIMGIFGGGTGGSDIGRVALYVSIFLLFALVKTFFIMGTIKLGKVFKNLTEGLKVDIFGVESSRTKKPSASKRSLGGAGIEIGNSEAEEEAEIIDVEAEEVHEGSGLIG